MLACLGVGVCRMLECNPTYAHHPRAKALQSPSGAGAACVAGFGLCDFGSTFSKKVERNLKKNTLLI